MLNTVFRKGTLAIAVTGALSGQLALANAEDKIERVQVWGTQVKASSVYMGEDAIANKQANHLSDLLREIPGVDVGGASSLNQAITIRALDDRDLRISIDGANQNTYMYHHMGNLQIHADILKSVDIEVGTNSVINGGLGGAVRFETKDAVDLLSGGDQFGARVQANYADNAGDAFSITAYGQLTESVDFLAYYNSVNNDNFEVGGGKILDHTGQEMPNTDGTVRGLEGDVEDALIKLGWNIDESQRLEIGYENYQDEGNYSYRPDMGLATDIVITDNLNIPLLWPTEFSRDTLTLNYDLAWGDNSDLKVAIFSNESELWRDQSGWAQNPKFAGRAGVVTGTGKNTGLNIIGNSVLNGDIVHDLTYGLEVIKFETEYQIVALDNTVTNSGEESVNSAVFIEDRIDFANGFFLIPGLRYDSYDLDSHTVKKDFSDVSFALAGEYHFNEAFLVKLSTTELYKGPELAEIFTGAGSSDVANPDIDAESGLNTELALAYQDAVLGADNFSAGISVFQTEIENYIDDSIGVPGGGSRDYWQDNIGDMTIDGFELYATYEIDAFVAGITYSSADSKLDANADYESEDNKRLDQAQGDTVSAKVEYYFEDINLTTHYDMLWVESLKDAPALGGASTDNSKKGFVVHNLFVNWQPEQVEGLTVIFGIDNIFDEYYASQSSRTGVTHHGLFGDLFLHDYEPGRNAKLTVAYTF